MVWRLLLSLISSVVSFGFDYTAVLDEVRLLDVKESNSWQWHPSISSDAQLGYYDGLLLTYSGVDRTLNRLNVSAQRWEFPHNHTLPARSNAIFFTVGAGRYRGLHMFYPATVHIPVTEHWMCVGHHCEWVRRFSRPEVPIVEASKPSYHDGLGALVFMLPFVGESMVMLLFAVGSGEWHNVSTSFASDVRPRSSILFSVAADCGHIPALTVDGAGASSPPVPCVLLGVCGGIEGCGVQVIAVAVVSGWRCSGCPNNSTIIETAVVNLSPSCSGPASPPCDNVVGAAAHRESVIVLSSTRSDGVDIYLLDTSTSDPPWSHIDPPPPAELVAPPRDVFRLTTPVPLAHEVELNGSCRTPSLPFASYAVRLSSVRSTCAPVWPSLEGPAVSVVAQGVLYLAVPPAIGDARGDCWALDLRAVRAAVAPLNSTRATISGIALRKATAVARFCQSVRRVSPTPWPVSEVADICTQGFGAAHNVCAVGGEVQSTLVWGGIGTRGWQLGLRWPVCEGGRPPLWALLSPAGAAVPTRRFHSVVGLGSLTVSLFGMTSDGKLTSLVAVSDASVEGAAPREAIVIPQVAPRADAACATVALSVYCFGGVVGQSVGRSVVTSELLVFDMVSEAPAAQQVSFTAVSVNHDPGAAWPAARRGARLVRVPGTLEVLLLGGEGDAGVPLADCEGRGGAMSVWVLNVVTLVWRDASPCARVASSISREGLLTPEYVTGGAPLGASASCSLGHSFFRLGGRDVRVCPPPLSHFGAGWVAPQSAASGSARPHVSVLVVGGQSRGAASREVWELLLEVSEIGVSSAVGWRSFLHAWLGVPLALRPSSLAQGAMAVLGTNALHFGGISGGGVPPPATAYIMDCNCFERPTISEGTPCDAYDSFVASIFIDAYNTSEVVASSPRCSARWRVLDTSPVQLAPRASHAARLYEGRVRLTGGVQFDGSSAQPAASAAVEVVSLTDGCAVTTAPPVLQLGRNGSSVARNDTGDFVIRAALCDSMSDLTITGVWAGVRRWACTPPPSVVTATPSLTAVPSSSDTTHTPSITPLVASGTTTVIPWDSRDRALVSELCLPCGQGAVRLGVRCLSCGRGQWSAELDAACSPCPAGTIGSFNGASSVRQCIPCQPGTYNPTSGAPTCHPCTSPKACPLGSSTDRSMAAYDKVLQYMGARFVTPLPFKSPPVPAAVYLSVPIVVFIAAIAVVCASCNCKRSFKHALIRCDAFAWRHLADPGYGTRSRRTYVGGVCTFVYVGLAVGIAVALISQYVFTNEVEDRAYVPVFDTEGILFTGDFDFRFRLVGTAASTCVANASRVTPVQQFSVSEEGLVLPPAEAPAGLLPSGQHANLSVLAGVCVKHMRVVSAGISLPSLDVLLDDERPRYSNVADALGVAEVTREAVGKRLVELTGLNAFDCAHVSVDDTSLNPRLSFCEVRWRCVRCVVSDGALVQLSANAPQLAGGNLLEATSAVSALSFGAASTTGLPEGSSSYTSALLHSRKGSLGGLSWYTATVPLTRTLYDPLRNPLSGQGRRFVGFHSDAVQLPTVSETVSSGSFARKSTLNAALKVSLGPAVLHIERLRAQSAFELSADLLGVMTGLFILFAVGLLASEHYAKSFTRFISGGYYEAHEEAFEHGCEMLLLELLTARLSMNDAKPFVSRSASSVWAAGAAKGARRDLPPLSAIPFVCTHEANGKASFRDPPAVAPTTVTLPPALQSNEVAGGDSTSSESSEESIDGTRRCRHCGRLCDARCVRCLTCGGVTLPPLLVSTLHADLLHSQRVAEVASVAALEEKRRQQLHTLAQLRKQGGWRKFFVRRRFLRDIRSAQPALLGLQLKSPPPPTTMRPIRRTTSERATAASAAAAIASAPPPLKSSLLGSRRSSVVYPAPLDIEVAPPAFEITTPGHSAGVAAAEGSRVQPSEDPSARGESKRHQIERLASPRPDALAPSEALGAGVHSPPVTAASPSRQSVGGGGAVGLQ